jgi:cytochrome c553
MKKLVLVGFAAALMLGAAQAQDEAQDSAQDSAPGVDMAAAEKVYASVCKNCHGPTGAGMASFPRLAGKDADYLASRLKQYRAGEMVGPNSPLMMPHAAKLSDAEIASLAAYISTKFQ